MSKEEKTRVGWIGLVVGITATIYYVVNLPWEFGSPEYGLLVKASFGLIVGLLGVALGLVLSDTPWDWRRKEVG